MDQWLHESIQIGRKGQIENGDIHVGTRQMRWQRRLDAGQRVYRLIMSIHVKRYSFTVDNRWFTNYGEFLWAKPHRSKGWGSGGLQRSSPRHGHRILRELDGRPCALRGASSAGALVDVTHISVSVHDMVCKHYIKLVCLCLCLYVFIFEISI